MVERIPQHRHCHTCGKAFTGKDVFCNDACKGQSEQDVKSKKRQLMMLWGLSAVVLVVVLLLVM